MKVVKYLILLLIVSTLSGWIGPAESFAKSQIPSSCMKIKHEMVLSCNNREKSCEIRTNALNRCLRKSAYRPVSKTTPINGAVCAMVYEPVCALSSKGNLEIFGNSCQAANAGATEVNRAECQSK